MYCAACGYHDMSLGGRHTCAARDILDDGPRVPATWQYVAWAVLALAGGYLLLCVVRIVLLIQDRGRLTSGHELTVDGLQAIVTRDGDIGALWVLVSFAGFAASVGWFKVLRKVAEPYGERGAAALTHWSLFSVLLVYLVSGGLAAYLMADRPSAGLDNLPALRDQLAAYDVTQIVITVLRFVLGVLLIVAVSVLRTRVRDLIGQRSLGHHFIKALRLRRVRRQTAR